MSTFFNFCGKWIFGKANTKDFLKTLASIQPNFIVPAPYLYCTELPWRSYVSPENTKTPSAKYSEMPFSDFFGSCNWVYQEKSRNFYGAKIQIGWFLLCIVLSFFGISSGGRIFNFEDIGIINFQYSLFMQLFIYNHYERRHVILRPSQMIWTQFMSVCVPEKVHWPRGAHLLCYFRVAIHIASWNIVVASLLIIHPILYSLSFN